MPTDRQLVAHSQDYEIEYISTRYNIPREDIEKAMLQAGRNHKWKDNKCVNCSITRERKTFKLLMAMVGNKDYYKYETGYVYHLNDGDVSNSKRPDCKIGKYGRSRKMIYKVLREMGYEINTKK